MTVCSCTITLAFRFRPGSEGGTGVTRIVAVVEFDEQDLPEELERIPLETWGAGELGLLLQDGDGGIAMA